MSAEKKGLTGDNIDEEKAKQIAKEFAGAEDIEAKGFSENGDIPVYNFDVKVRKR